MANAKKDPNRISTLIALSSTDGTTIIPVQVNSSSHILQISDAATGSDKGGDKAAHDVNRVPTLIGISSADGVTPIAVYADSSGNLLVKST